MYYKSELQRNEEYFCCVPTHLNYLVYHNVNICHIL